MRRRLYKILADSEDFDAFIRHMLNIIHIKQYALGGFLEQSKRNLFLGDWNIKILKY